MPIGIAEFIENQENRCPVILVLDTSGSMQGAPIQALNQGIQTFKEDVMRDHQALLSVETAIVTFGKNGAQKIQEFVGIDEFEPPTLPSGGLTPMGEAINMALDMMEERKQAYKQNGIQYYRPWVFLITDGVPTDDWQLAARRVQEAEDKRQALFFAVGVEGADMNTLRLIANNPPVLLNGLDFRDLFQWLSSSMKRVSSSKVGEAIALPATELGANRTQVLDNQLIQHPKQFTW